jgi:prophage DNA circulation protein
MSGIGTSRLALALRNGAQDAQDLANFIDPAEFSVASDVLDNLQPASFRGVPFGVILSESRHGRRLALHEYPYRDEPWPEDLGKAPRKFAIQGFLITDSLIYGGGDVIDQVTDLIEAVETAGAGTLIHPVLGRVQVCIPEDGLVVTAPLTAATCIEFTLACYTAGERKFPTTTADSVDGLEGAADAMDSASGADFLTDVADALRYGGQIVNMAVNTATHWVAVLERVASDATGIFNLAAALPGEFGRFFNGALSGYANSLGLTPTTPTLEDLIFRGTQARADVIEAGDDLIVAADTEAATVLPARTQAAVAALVIAIPNPADAVRLLTQLANFYPSDYVGPSVVGQASGVMQTALGNLVRRSTLAALVRVVEAYQPKSEEEANSVRLAVCALLEAEAVVAGDSGDDLSYAAITRARAAVATELDARGAQLPPMRQFELKMSLPSLVVAQMLYQDSTRADQLVDLAAPRHPAFMPLSFKALSS